MTARRQVESPAGLGVFLQYHELAEIVRVGLNGYQPQS